MCELEEIKVLKLPIFPPVYKAGTGHKGSSVHLARIYTEDGTIGLAVNTRVMAKDTTCEE